MRNQSEVAATLSAIMVGCFRIQVLGRFGLWRDRKEVGLGRGRERALLAMLVLAGGQPVSRRELVTASEKGSLLGGSEIS
jgi:hypothetical protein